MAKRIEAFERAIGVIAFHPWTGQIAEKVYTARRPIFDDNGDNKGTQVSLTAVWEGAARLAENPAVRCIVLERNPNRRGLENAISLRIDLVNGRGSERLDYVFSREGVVPIIGKGRKRLVQTVLGNITKLNVQP